MKKIISLFITTSILLSIFNISVSADGVTKFAVASDLHYNVPEEELTATNDDEIFWYANRRAAMDNESGFIIDEFLSQVADAKECDFVLIPGDLADNGRRIFQEHYDVAEKLEKFEKETGISVYVIPGNHDYGAGENDFLASDFERVYADFGYNGALTQRDSDCSYTADLTDDYRLIAVDSCDPTKSTEDGMTSDKVEWVLEETEKAYSDGKYPILMMHHNLLDHLPLQRILSRNFIIRNHLSVANKFADAGIKLVFSGHEHCSDATVHTSPSGNKIYDFANTALSMYPLSYRVFTMSDEEISYEARYIEKIDTDTLRNTVEGYTDDMINLMNDGLNSFSKGYLKAGVEYRLARSLTMEQIGISEKDFYYPLVNTAVNGLTSILEMPLYGENSVQELAKEYNIEIPDSEYKNGWDLATELVSYHYAGEEPFDLYSTEVTILLRTVNLILLDDLSTVNDEIFLKGANMLLKKYGTDSVCKDLTKLGTQVFGSVTPGQYFLLALASPILYEFALDTDGINDNNGIIEGYGADESQIENAIENMLDIIGSINKYLENIFRILLKIIGVGR